MEKESVGVPDQRFDFGDLHLELDPGFNETTLKRVLQILEERR